jgi:hypothetical protein
MNRTDIELWAATHETDEAIVIAIEQVAKGDRQAMQMIWENPKDAKFKILKIAFESTEDDELIWGEEEYHRDDMNATPKFTCTNIMSWRKGLINNRDAYGRRCYTYAEYWAQLMEDELKRGRKIAETASVLSHKADTDGIQGFMYNAAVTILIGCWKHGEKLRKWHSLNVQIGNEGERANETGHVLNSAMMSIGGVK